MRGDRELLNLMWQGEEQFVLPYFVFVSVNALQAGAVQDEKKEIIGEPVRVSESVCRFLG